MSQSPGERAGDSRRSPVTWAGVSGSAGTEWTGLGGSWPSRLPATRATSCRPSGPAGISGSPAFSLWLSQVPGAPPHPPGGQDPTLGIRGTEGIGVAWEIPEGWSIPKDLGGLSRWRKLWFREQHLYTKHPVGVCVSSEGMNKEGKPWILAHPAGMEGYSWWSSGAVQLDSEVLEGRGAVPVGLRRQALEKATGGV